MNDGRAAGPRPFPARGSGLESRNAHSYLKSCRTALAAPADLPARIGGQAFVSL